MENYFTFNGVSSKEFHIQSSNPPIIIPRRNMKQVNVVGRSGSLLIDEGSYSDIYMDIKCRIYDKKDIGSIYQWLNGVGKLCFSSMPHQYYIGYVCKDIHINYILEDYRSFNITFCCKPYKYYTDHEDDFLDIRKSPFYFYGKGNLFSLPKIKVYGNGIINLTINNSSIKLSGVNQYVEMDSEIMSAYKDSVNMNKNMVGDFATLRCQFEKNEITYTGSVSKIEIEPRWREV